MRKSLAILAFGALPAVAWAGDPAPAPPPPTPAPTAAPAAAPAAASDRETNCTDRRDDDGDGMVDCADADCAKSDACKAGSGPENSNDKCSDWFDNDGDGFIDCDDPDCEASGITVCKGSWKGPEAGGPAVATDDVPELGAGQSVEDLIGKGSDKDGERSDEVCSDGVDNDGDGRVDCADFGCRFDPEVSVCRGNPGMRFSIVAGIEGSRLETGTKNDYDAGNVKPGFGTHFSKLQLRTFGPMPMIQNSFYMVSIRAERDTRTTFAMFQVPLGTHGHFFNINSGGGGLSAALITSTSKLLLINPAYYMSASFEQANGAAMEAFGPLTPDFRFTYRAFAAGGSGRSTGVIGGTYYNDDTRNYTYSVGGQIGINFIGILNRFDSPFLYTPVATTAGMTIGAKFDQRSQERYPAVNTNAVVRSGRIYGQAEFYGKRSLDFDNTVMAWNLQLGVLVIPKLLMIAADYGNLIAEPIKNPPANLDTTLKKQLDEWQFRTAVHVYFFKNIGLVSALYRLREVADPLAKGNPTRENELMLSTQFRF